MKGILYIQLDRWGKRVNNPKPLVGNLDLGKDDTAIVTVGNQVKAKLTEASVRYISADGMMITGIEGNTMFNSFQYQEWWFVPGAGTE